MKRVTLLVLLAVSAFSSNAYAQDSSVRLGLSSASYNSWTPDNFNTSVAFGTEGSFFYVGTRLDFNRESAYWNVFQLEIGPRFLRAGSGIILGNPNERSDQLRVNFGATFKPWKGFYINSRWAPVSLNNRPNNNNFLDASLGWQFNF